MKKLLPMLLMLAAASVASAAPDGAALFAQHCAACHQPDASGAVGLAPALKGEHWQKLGADRGYLPMVITHGLSGAIEVNGTRFVGSMPAFAAQLDDVAIAAIATHLQSLHGGGADYSAAEVAAARAAPGNPGQSRQRRQQVLGK